MLNVLAGVVAWLITTDIVIGLVVFVCIAVGIAAWFILGSSVRAKFQFHKRLKHYGVVGHYEHQADSESLLLSLLGTAARLDILSVRGLGLFALTDSLTRKLLVSRRGQIRVRILMLEPNSEFVRVRARDVGDETGALRTGIRLAKAAADELMKGGVDITCRYYSRKPVWRLLIIDERMFVSAFLPGVEGHDSPVLELKYTGPRGLYAILALQFEEMWGAP